MTMDLPSFAVSVQQPWAWLIINGFKDVENRTWTLPGRYVGARVLIHASARPGFSLAAAREILEEIHALHGLPGGLCFPEQGRESGGIIGLVDFAYSTRDHVSPWCAAGQCHWRIASARPLPFFPCKGQLGFFRVDYRPGTEMRGCLMEVGS